MRCKGGFDPNWRGFRRKNYKDLAVFHRLMEKEEFYHQPTLPNLTGGEKQFLPFPERIGPYKIDTLLSKGGMRYLIHPEMVSQFLKEAKIIALTDHPNIIKLYGQGEWENGLYIAMEFVQGISLKQFIMQQNLSIRSSLDIILQVAYALLHLHTHGVIHRDLKPENIIITENGQVKVIDFGIAQLTYETEKASHLGKGRFIGTPSYMSPEQKRDPLHVTYAADIYSLGVITFELIIGKLSYGSIQLSLLPPDLQKIVEKALKPSLEERYQDIVDFITDISKYLKSQAIDRMQTREIERKEIWERLEEGHQDLLPSSCPKWRPFDIGYSQSQTTSALGFFYDFIRFADQTYLIVMGELNQNHVHSIAYVGLLKGMIQSLTRSFLLSSDKHFEPILFITALNEMLSYERKDRYFAFHLLHLLPQKNRLSFISCGYDPLVHLPSETTVPRFLQSQNPLLGLDPNYDFYETTENWNEGDLLILHSFNPQTKEAKEIKNLEELFKAILPTRLQLSAQVQAENLLQDLFKASPSTVENFSKSIMTIHRIV
jgi:serine/threonine protein kinase